MDNKLITKDITIEYNDYKNFINFIYNQYKISLKNIDPFEFFRLSEISEKIDLGKLISKFFKGSHVQIPSFRTTEDGFNHHTRFEDFTAKDEVHNLSLWSLSCLKKLSYESETRLGKELEILQTKNPRDGRLDIAILSNNQILVLEAKVSLSSLLREGRFKFQIPAYLEEGIRKVKEYNLETGSSLNFNIFLVIGGEETDLYPPDHLDCTGRVGNISKIFYDSLKDYNLKFISANALWALASYSEVLGKKVYWYDLLPEIFTSKESLGLLSGGIVSSREGRPEIIPITL